MSSYKREGFSAGEVGRKLKRLAEVLRGSSIDIEDYDPETHGPLLSFDGVSGMEEVERYWVNAPFAFASINFDPEEHEHTYYVVEPDLNKLERRLLDTLFEDIRDALIYRKIPEDGKLEDVIKLEIKKLLEAYGARVDMQSFYKLFYYVDRSFRGYGRIEPLMHDPHIEDVSCSGYDMSVYIYHDKYTDMETNLSFGEDELDDFVVNLAQKSGRHISIGTPIIGTTLPDGSRIELNYDKEVTPHGSVFTIRRFGAEPMTPVDLVDTGTFDLDQMAYFWLAVENNKSLIFAGGTAAGKTTTMNAVSMFIPARTKVLTIEDTREIRLYHENWLSSVSREASTEEGRISLYDLLKSALRHRPEYIIVGEVRGVEAMTLFQAMSTGHTTFSTMHADSIQTVINRLENEPLSVPRVMMQALDIVCVQSLTKVEERRVRRARNVYEVEGLDPGTEELIYSTVYRWQSTEDVYSKRESEVLEEIREENGWSRSQLLREIDNRKKILRHLQETEISPGGFTATINEYNLQPELVLDRIGSEGGEEGGPGTE